MSSKSKIYIYTSDIASFIGQNKWDFVTPFERLWKRCDYTGYGRAVAEARNELLTNNAQLAALETERAILKNDLQNRTITARQFSLKIKNVEISETKIKQTVETLEEKIDDITLTQGERIEKQLGKELLSQLQDTKMETSEKRKRADAVIKDTDMPDAKRETLKKHAESFINKTHGTLKEQSAIEMYEAKFGVSLDVSQEFFKRKLESISAASIYDWYICGKMDGIYRDISKPEDNYIVEIKNRTRGFFNGLRDYEKTQVQIYLWMTDFNKAQLVEKSSDRIRVTAIYRDEDYIADTLEYLQIFVDNFENRFLQHNQEKQTYIHCTPDTKRIYLKQLYLNDINIRLNQKIAADLSESSDNECHVMSSDEF